jgi:opacity protein-like surface antigen
VSTRFERTSARKGVAGFTATLVVAVAAGLAPSPATAQQSSEEARAAAAAAREASAAAQAQLEAAQAELARAQAEAAAQAQAAESLAAQAQQVEAVEAARVQQAKAAAAEQGDPVAEAKAAAQEAERRAIEAEKAALEAQIATARLEKEVAALTQRFAYDRKGLFFGGGAFWAPELFDVPAQVDDSRGVYGRVGYRFHRRFAMDVRFDWLEQFDIENENATEFDITGENASGSIQPLAITTNARIYILTNRIQPYLNIGLGASYVDTQGTTHPTSNPPSTRFEEKGWEGMLRLGVGTDIYVTPSIVLNLDASAAGVSGDHAGVNVGFGQLGAGLEFRF